jgi:glycosyltransferase involved in cell wall biosynthesis
MPEKYFFGTRHFYFGEEWVKKGHNVTIFTSTSNHLTDKLPVFEGKSMVEDIDGVQTVWLNAFKSKGPSSFSRIISWIHFEWLLLGFVRKHCGKIKKCDEITLVESLKITKSGEHITKSGDKTTKSENITLVESLKITKSGEHITNSENRALGESEDITKSDYEITKCKSYSPDVVIVSSLSLLSILSGWYFSKKYKSRFLLEIRDIWPLTAIQSGGFSKWNPFIMILSWIERFGYRKADAVIGTMPNLIEHVREVEPRFKECVNIPQGIPTAALDKHELLDPAYLADVFYRPAFRVAYVGTINASNPVNILLDAAVMMGPHSGVDFYLLGRGSLKDTYVQKYGYHPHIHFPDVIEKKFVRNFLTKVDLCYDAIGGQIAKFGHSRNKWMDYMAASRPIVCASSGFLSILNEADCGTFVPFNDVQSLHDEILKYKKMDSAERMRLGQNARQYLIEHRTFDKLASKYEELF